MKQDEIHIPQEEIEFIAIRAQGAGGQNVNKVSSAIHLRFNIHKSSLSPEIKARLLEMKDSRINREGILVIKAQRFRTQDKNRDDATRRLYELIKQATVIQKKRIPTRPKSGSIQKRLDTKSRQAKTKTLRKKITDTE